MHTIFAPSECFDVICLFSLSMCLRHCTHEFRIVRTHYLGSPARGTALAYGVFYHLLQYVSICPANFLFQLWV